MQMRDGNFVNTYGKYLKPKSELHPTNNKNVSSIQIISLRNLVFELLTLVSVTRQWNVRAPASEASILLRICHELHVAMSSHNLISNTISLTSYYHFEKAVFEISDL